MAEGNTEGCAIASTRRTVVIAGVEKGHASSSGRFLHLNSKTPRNTRLFSFVIFRTQRFQVWIVRCKTPAPRRYLMFHHRVKTTLPFRGRTPLLLCLVFALTLSSPAQTWISTSTQGLGTVLANAVQLGPLPASTTLHIAVALKLNNRDLLVQYVKAINDPSSPLYGSSLTVSQFVANYAPTSAQVQSVVNYLVAQGFSNIQLEPNNLFVTADGTVAEIGAAFFTSIIQFQQNGRTIYANLTDAHVPSALGGSVAAVLGLNNAGRMAPPMHKQAPASTLSLPAVHFYTPQGYWTAYDVAGTATGSRTTIAIFAQGDLTQVLKDLRVAESVNHLPPVPVQVVQVGLASPDTAGLDEWDLQPDVHRDGGQCGQA